MALRTHDQVRAVLFERNDLVGDGGRALPGARRAVTALRAAGLQVGVVTDVGDETDLEPALGPLDVTCRCSGDDAEAHRAAVVDAADRLHLDPAALVLVGGSSADVRGAHEAGAGSIVVTDGDTSAGGVETADVVVDTVVDAAALLLHRLRPRTA